MKKSRASLEPFWDLKISKYIIEYLTRVSSEYITSQGRTQDLIQGVSK